MQNGHVDVLVTEIAKLNSRTSHANALEDT